MSLEKLPEEIWRIILKELDLIDIKHLYDTEKRFIQDMVSSAGVTKECHLTGTGLASVQTLSQNFFKAISQHITCLDLSGVDDLSEDILLPAMKRLNSLITLNVAHTNITTLNLLNIYEHCKTIKNISINIDIDFNLKNVHPETIKKYQNMFAAFENVHFVVVDLSFQLKNDGFLILLKDSKLNTFMLTILPFVIPNHNSVAFKDVIIFHSIFGNALIKKCKSPCPIPKHYIRFYELKNFKELRSSNLWNSFLKDNSMSKVCISNTKKPYIVEYRMIICKRDKFLKNQIPYSYITNE